MEKKSFDIVILGAGASGMLCAHYAAASGKQIGILDHNKQVGRKILISGGGKCNFTNLYVEPTDYYCTNPHFVKSALSRFSPYDFVEMIEEDKVEYEHRKLGQLFCKKSAKDVIELLRKRATKSNTEISLEVTINTINKEGDYYYIELSDKLITCKELVVATGGLSIPTIGATDFGHQLAKQFGHKILPAFPALVPFKFQGMSHLSGISLVGTIKCRDGYSITEDILITHKGISGPATLKASLFWNSGEEIIINWLPEDDLDKILDATPGALKVEKLLKRIFPNKLAEYFQEQSGISLDMNIASLNKQLKMKILKTIHEMKITPDGTEGFRKAEATRGGVDTSKISSKTMESQLSPGLYFIGEVLDVTGNLGGFNFQWAWASAYAAGSTLAQKE